MMNITMNAAIKAISKRSVLRAVARGPSQQRLLLASSPYCSLLSQRRFFEQRPVLPQQRSLSMISFYPRPVIPLLLLDTTNTGISQQQGSSCRALVVAVSRDLTSSSNVFPDDSSAAHQYTQLCYHVACMLFHFVKNHAVLKEIRKVFTFEDKEAIEYYTGDGFRTLNNHLRGNADAPYDAMAADEMIERILRAMNKLPPPTFKINKKTGKPKNQLYRGTTLPGGAIAQAIEVGATFSDPGFLSTSMKDFKTFKAFRECEYQFTIIGKSGVDVSGHSVHKKEAEILFRPGTHFKITKVNRKGRQCQVEMEEIGEE